MNISDGELMEGVDCLREEHREHRIDRVLLELLQIARAIAGVDLQVDVLLAGVLVGSDLQSDGVGEADAENFFVARLPIEIVFDLLAGTDLLEVPALEDQVGRLWLTGRRVDRLWLIGGAHDMRPEYKGDGYKEAAQTIEPHC